MIDIHDARALILLSSLGVPYNWGGGSLAQFVRDPDIWHCRDSAGVLGVDCEGHASWGQLRLGRVLPNAYADITAHDLANACDPVPEDRWGLGLLAFYGELSRSTGKMHISHVMTLLCGGLYPMVIGASGGDHTTHGDKASACVQVRHLRYRSDLVVVGTLKPQFCGVCPS